MCGFVPSIFCVLRIRPDDMRANANGLKFKYLIVCCLILFKTIVTYYCVWSNILSSNWMWIAKLIAAELYTCIYFVKFSKSAKLYQIIHKNQRKKKVFNLCHEKNANIYSIESNLIITRQIQFNNVFSSLFFSYFRFRPWCIKSRYR